MLFPRIALWLFVINLGVAFGAGLYESRVVVPQWIYFSPESGYQWNAAAAREANTGLRFWVFVTTVPLTLLTVLSLVGLWRTPVDVRNWWLAAVAAILVDRAMTFGYFMPTMVGLMNREASAETVSTALRWANLDYVRHAATLVAWLAALRAFSLFR